MVEWGQKNIPGSAYAAMLNVLEYWSTMCTSSVKKRLIWTMCLTKIN
jgi:hypothetical protein